MSGVCIGTALMMLVHLSLVASWVLLIPAYVDWHGCVDISYSGLTAVSGIQE